MIVLPPPPTVDFGLFEKNICLREAVYGGAGHLICFNLRHSRCLVLLVLRSRPGWLQAANVQPRSALPHVMYKWREGGEGEEGGGGGVPTSHIDVVLRPSTLGSLTMPGRSTLGFHRPGRHRAGQARSAVRCTAGLQWGVGLLTRRHNLAFYSFRVETHILSFARIRTRQRQQHDRTAAVADLIG